MKKTIQVHRLHQLHRRLANNRGMTLSELLVAMLIMLLVSTGMAQGIQIATVQYKKAMIRSESKILSSTLESIISNELSNTGTVTLSATPLSTEKPTEYPVISFFSWTYAITDAETGFYSVDVVKNASNDDDQASAYSYQEAADCGELLLGTKTGTTITGNLLLSSASYSSYHLGAKVASLTYDTTQNVFHVTLEVSDKNGYTLETPFDVIPLNTVRINQ